MYLPTHFQQENKVSQNRSKKDAEHVAKALDTSNPEMAKSVRKCFSR